MRARKRAGAHPRAQKESLNMGINTRHMAHLDGRWSFGLKYFTSPPTPLQPSPPVDELCIHTHNLKLIQLILRRFFFIKICIHLNFTTSEHYIYAHDGWIRPPNPHDHINTSAKRMRNNPYFYQHDTNKATSELVKRKFQRRHMENRSKEQHLIDQLSIL